MNLTRDTPARHAPYFSRFGQLLGAASSKFRYAAYASDVGEAVRPVVARRIVRATYGVAWTYVFVDVGYHGFKAKTEDAPDVEVVRAVTHAVTFQVLASILVPMCAIHTQVHAAHLFFHKIRRFTKWGPSVAGLMLLPALPFCVDPPVERGVDWVFDTYWPVGAKSSEPN